MHLFAYGTLMHPAIIKAVTGNVYTGIKAKLPDYSRRALRNEVYPAIIAEPGANVEGVLYQNIQPEAWMRLDRFEGDMYDRKVVQVEIEGGPEVRCSTYVIKPQYMHVLDQVPWNYHAFLLHHQQQFSKDYFGWDEL